jgi:hypothetical protein
MVKLRERERERSSTVTFLSFCDRVLTRKNKMFKRTQLVVSLLTTTIYLDTLRYEFTYDDKKAVVTNIDVQEVRIVSLYAATTA